MIKYQIPREHYFRMYNKVFDLDLKATTFLVYSYLVCCAGNKGSCWPSPETISRKTGLSVSTVQEHLKILEQRQLISKSRHRIDGGWEKNNVYTLLSLDNPEVYRSLLHRRNCRCTSVRNFPCEARIDDVWELFVMVECGCH